jgi:hypothetical protein
MLERERSLMPSNLNFVIDQVGKDKGIDRKVIIEALEQAVLTASRKKYGHQGEIEVRYNEEAGEGAFPVQTGVEEVVTRDGDLLEEARNLDNEVRRQFRGEAHYRFWPHQPRRQTGDHPESAGC